MIYNRRLGCRLLPRQAKEANTPATNSLETPNVRLVYIPTNPINEEIDREIGASSVSRLICSSDPQISDTDIH